ncbi:hypothetical protein A3C18_01110 [Candidatus Kaiserbacteria bacterium RIFCSPHIGHO2_02_FULL_54_11b]|uniref:Uncharacterized protein n=2 Tax=Candidatus Kaiseribacteriota TaxID=1752734 RepID=A0A1F6CJU8_9BACT|nr:MAG: hypothetical protein A2704_04350 [Candidatus Kaiserbacteria bacterium RIFCSPHIGHO2_01_FULL_54_36b]OGG64808.1 MAG: hypothetical protein A3C18_01110 [Candidatus Kaiserbacteria bacterium RIFCSPHIGHO2_02_FULL_54_11b]
MKTLEDMAAEIKEISRRTGKEMSDEEANEAAFTMNGLAELAVEVGMRYANMRGRLRKEPKGFSMEHGASCTVCHNGFEAGKGWFDKYEQKCLLCQRAVDEGVIPGYVCLNSDSFYSMYDLNSKFKVKTQRVKKLIKENWFKARIVLDDSGRAHHYIFLKSENPQLAQAERFNPVWKSKERHNKKVNAVWSREQAKKLKEDLRAIWRR